MMFSDIYNFFYDKYFNPEESEIFEFDKYSSFVEYYYYSKNLVYLPGLGESCSVLRLPVWKAMHEYLETGKNGYTFTFMY